jgi:hypothetical protein
MRDLLVRWTVVGLFSENICAEMVDRLGELLPFRQLRLEQPGAGGGEAVVLARRTVTRFLPRGVDDAFALQAAQ